MDHYGEQQCFLMNGNTATLISWTMMINMFMENIVKYHGGNTFKLFSKEFLGAKSFF
jgi:hypothetical protein